MYMKSQKYIPLTFFLLVFILSIPLWWLGGSKRPIPINLPVSALTAFVPALAAAILSYQQSGWYGVKELIRKARDFKKINHNGWWEHRYLHL
jgi:hypothetical protein